MKVLKSTLLVLLYTILLSIILFFNNIGIRWLISKIMSPIFDWFYDIHWIWKIILLIFGAGAVIGFFINMFNGIAVIISTFVNLIFPYNKAMVVISSFLCTLSIIDLQIDFWKFIQWDFWVIIMWLILASFIIQANWIFVFRKPEETL